MIVSFQAQTLFVDAKRISKSDKLAEQHGIAAAEMQLAIADAQEEAMYDAPLTADEAAFVKVGKKRVGWGRQAAVDPAWDGSASSSDDDSSEVEACVYNMCLATDGGCTAKKCKHLADICVKRGVRKSFENTVSYLDPECRARAVAVLRKTADAFE